jgi:toxin-antitoxin system PIN domain toxin
MISCDTNIFFAACDADSPHQAKARHFLTTHGANASFCVCEQVLMELYCLLRNPTVCKRPLAAGDAAGMIHAFRSNRFWRIVDVVPGQGIMDQVWRLAAKDDFAYRRIFDIRLACTLRHHGVLKFATRNTKDFRHAGFQTVWDPTAD